MYSYIRLGPLGRASLGELRLSECRHACSIKVTFNGITDISQQGGGRHTAFENPGNVPPCQSWASCSVQLALQAENIRSSCTEFSLPGPISARPDELQCMIWVLLTDPTTPMSWHNSMSSRQLQDLSFDLYSAASRSRPTRLIAQKQARETCSYG